MSTRLVFLGLRSMPPWRAVYVFRDLLRSRRLLFFPPSDIVAQCALNEGHLCFFPTYLGEGVCGDMWDEFYTIFKSM
jgi:hypothetical protein